jgi:DNA-binding response OmpR family regulator
MTNGKEILILDDDQAIVEALTLMLEDAGYAVRMWQGRETVEDLLENVPGMLLLDIWLSGKDGRDLCRYLRSQPKTKHLPIILISANDAIGRIAREVGADDYLAKPFSMREVLAKVGKYLP